jgi:hypothetical protein
MKTRTLFLILLICISILVITSGLAFADPITGCVKKSTGVIYNVQTGDTPVYPCHFLDEQITWSEEGPQGEPGTPGENGQDGQDGAQGPAGPSGALADKVLAFGRVLPLGQVVYDGTGNFMIQHQAETRPYLIALNEPMDCFFNPSINMYFAKGTIVATHLFFGQGFIVARAIPKSTFDDCSNNPEFVVEIGLETGGGFHFLIVGDPAPTS